MAQEEESQRYSNSSGCGFGIGTIVRSSKKQKQKKVPQRGLGVAQLEKIRLEEQQKKDGSLIFPSSTTSITQTKASNLSVPIFSSPLPYPSDLSSPNSILRSQRIDFGNSNSTIPWVTSVGWQSVPVQGLGNVPKMWNSNSEYNLERESFGVDPGLAFRSSLNLPYESSPIWPLPSLMQRAQQYQQSCSSSSSSSMLNVSSANSSSVLNFHMEPPSNQSCYGNYTPAWLDEEKMVGMKRSYPFSLNTPQGPSLHYKFPSFVHPISRSSDEPPSFSNGGGCTFNFNPNNNYREGPSCSKSNLEPCPKKSKENGSFNGDFLTLAPPTTTMMTIPSSKSKPTHSHYRPINNYESFDFDSLPYQRNIEDPVLLQQAPTVPNQQQSYYSFLPTTVLQTGQATKTIKNCNGDLHEVGEKVDLNLKL